MRKTKKMLLGIMAVLALTGCSRGNTQTAPAQENAATVASAEQEKKEEEKVKLVLMHYAAEETKRNGIEAWVKSVEEQYPEIEIEIQAVTPWAQFASSLQTRIAAGDAPDIFMGKPSQFVQLVQAGQVMELTGQPYLDSLTDVDRSMVSVDGKVHGVPVDRSIAGVFYNKDMFEEYGLTPPATLEEFNQIIKTFEDHEIVPFVRPYKDNIYPRVEFDSSFGSLVATEDEGFYEKLQSGEMKFSDYPMFELQADIYAQRLMAKRDDDLGTDASRANQLFASGKYPMCITGSWAIGDIRKNNPDGNFGFFTTPWSDDPNENTLPVGVDTAFMASSQTKHPEEVAKFLAHLTSEEGVRQWYDNARVPTMIPVETTDLDSIFQDMNAIIESGKVVSKDSYPYFSGEYKSKFESDLQLFAATPEIGASGLIEMLEKDFAAISK